VRVMVEALIGAAIALIFVQVIWAFVLAAS
jgi:hypothetical protein